MKKVFILCLSLLSLSPLLSAKNQPLNAKTLPAGTLVLLETTEKIASDQVTVGKTVLFRVRANVVADGKTLIASGALAIGRVKAISPATFNFPEEITLEVLYAQAVDGQQVPLNGSEQTFRGQFPGESVIVEPAQMITATVMNNTSIQP